MDGEMVLGDIEASTDVASVERCAAFGFERKCAAIVYTSLSRNCDCLARITGYTDAADSQVSYFWYDFRQEMCLAKEQQHGIIRDIGKRQEAEALYDMARFQCTAITTARLASCTIHSRVDAGSARR